mgnify:CR=1 FL=1
MAKACCYIMLSKNSGCLPLFRCHRWIAFFFYRCLHYATEWKNKPQTFNQTGELERVKKFMIIAITFQLGVKQFSDRENIVTIFYLRNAVLICKVSIFCYQTKKL